MLSQTLEKSSITVHPTPRRVPGLPQLPTAGETRQIMEEHLLGLERAMLDREVLRAPDLRVMASRYLDHIQDVLDLDTAIEQGEVTPLSLRKSENLDIVARLVFRPLWVDDGAWLPPQIHAWIFAIDDAARRWQYIRRRWLADHCRLTLIPVVPSVTTLNSAWHTIIGEGQVVSAQLSPGFLLDDEVLRKATVRAE